jgi:hypothetical protein
MPQYLCPVHNVHFSADKLDQSEGQCPKGCPQHKAPEVEEPPKKE